LKYLDLLEIEFEFNYHMKYGDISNMSYLEFLILNDFLVKKLTKDSGQHDIGKVLNGR